MVLTRRTLFRGAVTALTMPLLDPLRALAAEVKRVRITDVESFRVRVPHQGESELVTYDYEVSRVQTDAGIVGTSFIGCPQEILQQWVRPALVGQNLFAIDRHIDRLQMQRGVSGVQTWSGVEHAMWDAIGRVANRPVAKLLGGARDKLRVYRTTVWPGKADQSDVAYDAQAQFALRLKQAGFTGIKVRAWLRTRWMTSIWLV